MSRLVPRPDPETLIAKAPPNARKIDTEVHPWGWWVWAIGCAVAVTVAFNPICLGLLIAAIVFVVVNRRGDQPWARSLKMYLYLAIFIIVVRMFFQVLTGGRQEGTVLFRLPEIPLPEWAAGISLGGPVILEGLIYTGVESIRLAALILAIGAANSLANPKRALRNLPAAFHQIATALVIAISAIPQLVESIVRVRRARKLRGGTQKGIKGIVMILVPVLEDSIDRSLALAAGMESRGYGRTRKERKLGLLDASLLLGSMLAITFAIFALLGMPHATWWASILLAAGLAAGVLAIRRSGHYLAVTKYRKDRWGEAENICLASGIAVAILLLWLNYSDPAMSFQAYPMHVPQFTPLMVLAGLIAALPGVLTPSPRKGLSKAAKGAKK